MAGKLTDEDAALIRQRFAEGVGRRELAKAFMVTPDSISRIVKGEAHAGKFVGRSDAEWKGAAEESLARLVGTLGGPAGGESAPGLVTDLAKERMRRLLG